jgi:hypothetical protein
LSEIIGEKALALSTLRSICADETAPATARASAARTILEMLGEIGRLQTEKPSENKSLHEMTREELDAELKRLASTVSKPGIRQRTRVQGKTSKKSKVLRAVQRPGLRRTASTVDAGEPELPF